MLIRYGPGSTRTKYKNTLDNQLIIEKEICLLINYFYFQVLIISSLDAVDVVGEVGAIVQEGLWLSGRRKKRSTDTPSVLSYSDMGKKSSTDTICSFLTNPYLSPPLISYSYDQWKQSSDRPELKQVTNSCFLLESF